MRPSSMWSWSREVSCDACLMLMVFASRNKLVRLSKSLEEKPTAQQHPQYPHQPHRFLHHGPDEVGGQFQLSKCQWYLRMLLWRDQLCLQLLSHADFGAYGAHLKRISKWKYNNLFNALLFCQANTTRTYSSISSKMVGIGLLSPPTVSL